jgi:hypothetical protein
MKQLWDLAGFDRLGLLREKSGIICPQCGIQLKVIQVGVFLAFFLPCLGVGALVALFAHALKALGIDLKVLGILFEIPVFMFWIEYGPASLASGKLRPANTSCIRFQKVSGRMTIWIGSLTLHELEIRRLFRYPAGQDGIGANARVCAKMKELNELRKILRSSAVIWISWPKKSSKVPTDITEDTIRKTALPLGFVDIKVCAVTEVWSGLKLVVRKELR